MASTPNPSNQAGPLWPVTFEDVREAQLRAALAATPAQRLAMAEELLELARLAESARSQATEKSR